MYILSFGGRVPYSDFRSVTVSPPAKSELLHRLGQSNESSL